MPARVDADERRRSLVLAAAELIAEEGIGALTHQRVAERLGASTTVVTHYFTNKRELVLQTYQTMASRSRARVERAIQEHDDPLAACLQALLPLDDKTRVEWKVWLAYQGTSVGDRELMKIWGTRSATAITRIARLIESDSIGARDRAPAVDPHDEAERLFALVQGMSFQSLVDPEHWRTDRLRHVVDFELARLRAG